MTCVLLAVLSVSGEPNACAAVQEGNLPASDFDKRAIVAAAKRKGKKGRKKKKKGKQAGDDFHPDVADPRFAAVYDLAGSSACRMTHGAYESCGVL